MPIESGQPKLGYAPQIILRNHRSHAYVRTRRELDYPQEKQTAIPAEGPVRCHHRPDCVATLAYELDDLSKLPFSDIPLIAALMHGRSDIVNKAPFLRRQ